MPLALETLQALSLASPYQTGGYSALGMEEVIGRLRDAGMMDKIAMGPGYDRETALRRATDSGLRMTPEQVLDSTYYKGRGEVYYSKIDLSRESLSGSTLADAAVARMAQEDPEAAHDYQRHLETNGRGAEGLFERIDSEIRQRSLKAVADQGRGAEALASVDEVQARRAMGRRM